MHELSVYATNSRLGGGARRRDSITPGGERDGQVLAGLSIVRLELQSLLKLADRLVGLAAPEESNAEVVIGKNVIRFQTDSLTALSD